MTEDGCEDPDQYWLTYHDRPPIEPRTRVNELEPYLVDWGPFWHTDYGASDWLCEPLIARGRTHSIVAAAKAGKSLLLLELAAALATGRPFLDHPGGDPITVVYCDYEMGEADLQDRLREFGYGPADDLTRLRYVLLPNIAPLDRPEGGQALVAAVLAWGASLVVIDTMTRAVEGEENAAETTRDLYRHSLQPLKQRGVATARADHTGKDEARGARGSSAKVADVDIQWQMKVAGAAVTLKSTSRMSWVSDEVKLTRRNEATPMHVFAAGTRAKAFDMAKWLRSHPGEWKTAAEGAVAMMGGNLATDGRAKRKAREQLNRLADNGIAERRDGTKGGDGGTSPHEYRIIPQDPF